MSSIITKIKVAFFFLGLSSLLWFAYRIIVDRADYIANGYSLAIDLIILFSVLCFASSMFAFILCGSKNTNNIHVLLGSASFIFVLNNVNIAIESIVITNNTGSMLLLILSIIIIAIQLILGFVLLFKKAMMISIISSLFGCMSVVIYGSIYFVYNLFDGKYIYLIIFGIACMLVSYLALTFAAKEARDN